MFRDFDLANTTFCRIRARGIRKRDKEELNKQDYFNRVYCPFYKKGVVSVKLIGPSNQYLKRATIVYAASTQLDAMSQIVGIGCLLALQNKIFPKWSEDTPNHADWLMDAIEQPKALGTFYRDELRVKLMKLQLSECNIFTLIVSSE